MLNPNSIFTSRVTLMFSDKNVDKEYQNESLANRLSIFRMISYLYAIQLVLTMVVRAFAVWEPWVQISVLTYAALEVLLVELAFRFSKNLDQILIFKLIL